MIKGGVQDKLARCVTTVIASEAISKNGCEIASPPSGVRNDIFGAKAPRNDSTLHTIRKELR